MPIPETVLSLKEFGVIGGFIATIVGGWYTMKYQIKANKVEQKASKKETEALSVRLDHLEQSRENDKESFREVLKEELSGIEKTFEKSVNKIENVLFERNGNMNVITKEMCGDKTASCREQFKIEKEHTKEKLEQLFERLKYIDTSLIAIMQKAGVPIQVKPEDS